MKEVTLGFKTYCYRNIPEITYYQCAMFKDEDFSPEKKKENLEIFFQGPEGVCKGN